MKFREHHGGLAVSFREHRGGLAESMETVVEVNSRVELVLHLVKIFKPYENRDDCPRDFSQMTIEPYGGMDERIGWDTYIVYLPGYGVLGFTDGPL